MKRVLFLFLVLLLSLAGCSSTNECPACGRTIRESDECPICFTSVCRYCADEEHFLEALYNSGEMEAYLRDKGYIVFSEVDEAFGLYVYGFLNGYDKGSHGVYDEEVREAESLDAEYLQTKYGEFGW